MAKYLPDTSNDMSEGHGQMTLTHHRQVFLTDVVVTQNYSASTQLTPHSRHLIRVRLTAPNAQLSSFRVRQSRDHGIRFSASPH